MPTSRVIRHKKAGYERAVWDSDHPDYTTRCPLQIRIRKAGKEMYEKFGAPVTSIEAERELKIILEIVCETHAIPLPLEVLKHARTYFVTRRMNPDELDDWFHDTESVKVCLDIINRMIDG